MPANLPFRIHCRAPERSQWLAFRAAINDDQAFLSPALADAWVESYLPMDRWHGPCNHLTVSDGSGVITGVFSYALMKFGPFELWAAAAPYFPYRGIPVDADPVTMAATCEILANAVTTFHPRRLGLRIGPVLSGDPAIEQFSVALRRRGWRVGTTTRGTTFSLTLPNNLSDWSEANSSLIKKVHYYQRRQGRTGVVQAKRYVGGTPADWPRIINELAQIEANSWISKEGDPKVTSDADKTFWRRLLERDETRDMIVIWILYYETRPISFSLQIEAASIMHIIANTYDEEFKENSPGHVLTYHVIKDAIERKIPSIEWGLGDSGFKQRWMAKPGRTFVDVIALPPGLVGRMSARLVERYSGFSFSAPSTAARKRFEHGAPA